jgi:hypothetical protein
MLHFLAGIALCIFIGERLVRWWRAWRLNRAVYRSLNYSPPERWRASERAAVFLMVSLVVAIVGAPLLLGL